MFGNQRIFISHTHADNERCQPLLAALDAWQLNYWFDIQELDAGQRFADRIQQALENSDILLRVSTASAVQSFWMERELRAVRGLRTAFPNHPRLIIHLLLGPHAMVDAQARQEVIIDAVNQPRVVWLKALRAALGYTPTTARISRRTALGIGALSLAAIATTGIAGKLYFTPTTSSTGFKPATAPQAATPAPGAGHLRWHISLVADVVESINRSLAGLVADDASLYSLTHDLPSIVAFDALSGKSKWIYPSATDAHYFFGNYVIALSNDTIYTLADVNTNGDSNASNKQLIALDKATGGAHWATPVGKQTRRYSGLAISDTGVFFQNEGSVYGYDLKGKALWHPLSLVIYPDSTSPNAFDYAAPTYAHGLVYIAMSDGRFYTIDAAKGKIVRSISLGAHSESGPVAALGNVYIGATDGYCYAFDASTGAPRWKQQAIAPAIDQFTSMPYPAVLSSLAIDGTSLYLAAGQVVNSNVTGGLIVALDASSGKILWQVDPVKILPSSLANVPDTVYPMLAAPVVQGDTLYCTIGIVPQQTVLSSQAIIALNKHDGTLQWYYRVPDSDLKNSAYFPSSPAVCAKGVAFIASNETIYVFNA